MLHAPEKSRLIQQLAKSKASEATDKKWVGRQRHYFGQMQKAGFEFIEFLEGEIVVRALPENPDIPTGAEITCDTPTSIRHQRLQSRLVVALAGFVTHHVIGEIFASPTDLVLSGKITQPDVVFLSAEKSHHAKEMEILGYADLVIEILSKNSIKRDRQTKFRIYQQAKIPSYWIVAPEANEIEAYKLTKKGYDMQAAFTDRDRLTYDFGNGKIFELDLKNFFEIS
jgi:Uma2 family endonuclease